MIDHTIRELGAIALRVILPALLLDALALVTDSTSARKITLRGTVRIRVATIFSKISVRIPAEVVAVARDAGPNGKP